MEDHLCILMTHLIRYKSRISTCRQLEPVRLWTLNNLFLCQITSF